MTSAALSCIKNGKVASIACHESIMTSENRRLPNDAAGTCVTERPAPPATPSGKTASKLINTELLVPDPYPLLENPLDVRIPLHLTWTGISEFYDDPLRPLMDSIQDETINRLSRLEEPLLVLLRFGYPEPNCGNDEGLATYHFHDAKVLAIQERPEYLNRCWTVVEGVVSH
ncbi:MAG: hypothetical protein Q9172_003542 [Xanthocarpia lactea]